MQSPLCYLTVHPWAKPLLGPLCLSLMNATPCLVAPCLPPTPTDIHRSHPESSFASACMWSISLTVSSPPGQPDHTPTRVGVPCVPPHSTYLPRSMNTHSLCTQNALHSPASVQITLAGSLPATQKSTIPLESETTRAGIAAWRICRYNLDTVPRDA